MVEVWGRQKDGKGDLLIDEDGLVINGLWKAKTDKENNTIFVEYTQKTHEAYFLGTVDYTGDYNETLDRFNSVKRHLRYEKMILTSI